MKKRFIVGLLLILQICHYDPMGSYLLVIAKAVND